MGKSNKQKSSKGGGKNSKASSTPKCECQDFYRCSCGNRPERPSRGHKWDSLEQKWTGKGHKQKGAGTTAMSKTAVVTKVGKTKLEQWQNLPSQLLADFCKKEKRPPFRCHPVDANKHKSSDSKQKYRFRIVVMDAKSTKRGKEYDLSFSPAFPSENEEQAKEEAAILALLHLTPNIPHDRKLPQPYKDIFLNAVKHHQKQQQKPPQTFNSIKNTKDISKQSNTETSNEKVTGNNESINTTQISLVMDRQFVSMADKRKHDQQKQIKRKVTLAKRQAIKEANKPHKVLMSESLRKAIQKLLKSTQHDANLDNTNISNRNTFTLDTSLIQEVEKLLLEDGFTTQQTQMALSNLNQKQQKRNLNEDDHEALDSTSAYEKCLQWLCIQVEERYLPKRFNPQGGNLDIISAIPTTSDSNNLSPQVLEIIHTYGILKEEAILIDKQNSVKKQIPNIFWECICNSVKKSNIYVKDISKRKSQMDDDTINMNLEQINDEIEVLQALFPDECEISYENGNPQDVGQTIKIGIPLNSEQFTSSVESTSTNPSTLEFHFQNGLYPSIYPSGVFLKNIWNKTHQSIGMGTVLHIKLAEYVSTLDTDVPMMYEIYSFVLDLLEQRHEAYSIQSPLLASLRGSKPSNTNEKKSDYKKRSLKNRKDFLPRKYRPRTRSPFWSKSPKKTLPATAFPDIPPSIFKARQNLPANKARDEFFRVLQQSLKQNRVLLVTGETGCGKTTQIPQFILEKYPAEAKIVIAQPRRLAATGVAGRVAAERGEEEPGKDSVGYVVRGDTAMCDKTRLMFCTTGVLLRQLQAENALDCITHIVVDEVHERHLDTDILLGILKEALPKYPHLHVVLMSATMDADRFAAYWGKNTPRMHIPGFTYPVEDYTLEDVLAFTGYIPPKKSKKKKQISFNNLDDEEHSKPQNNIDELVSRVQENIIDYEMIASLVKKLIQGKKYDDDGAILVFLPGAPEINKAEQTIRRHTKHLAIQLLPLHGGLQPKDQKLVFNKPKLGLTKVVLSTNVAETSITIPDITIVIDTCKEKQSTYDPVNRMPMLIERFASRDSLRQRRGRSGRVQKGTCYKLISQKTHDKLQQHGEPEIRRCALDQTLLSLLFLGVERGSGTFLSKLLDPPSRDAIDAAIFSLSKLGAIAKSSKTNEVVLTALGMHLAGIPAPPPIGKMLIIGSLLGCRSAALAMAAGMTVGRSPFLKVDVFNNQKYRKHRQNDEANINPEEELRREMEEMRQQRIIEERNELLKRVGKSDHAMLAAVYIKWSSMDGGRREYLDSLGVSIQGMRDIKQLAKQLDGSLKSIGFHESNEANINANSWKIIRTCVVAALAPSQVVRIHKPITKYSETVEGAIEKEGDAKELKFFVRNKDDKDEDQEDGQYRNVRVYEGIEEQRVFMHPSCANFKVGNFSFPWLVYHELVKTSKSFLRDATECSSYALLLFGGKIEIQAANELVLIDNWVKLSANARIGALIGGLREKVDELLAQKVSNPTLDISGCDEMGLIVDLIISDGLKN